MELGEIKNNDKFYFQECYKNNLIYLQVFNFYKIFFLEYIL